VLVKIIKDVIIKEIEYKIGEHVLMRPSVGQFFVDNKYGKEVKKW